MKHGIDLNDYLELVRIKGFFKGFLEGVSVTLEDPENREFVINQCKKILSDLYDNNDKD